MPTKSSTSEKNIVQSVKKKSESKKLVKNSSETPVVEEKKGKHPGGRPTKYEERYCQELLDFMERTSHEIVVDKTYYKAPDGVVGNLAGTGIELKGSLKSEKHEVFANVFPTLQRFCHKIGIHQDTLIEWATSVYPDDYEDKKLRGQLKHPEFSEAYRRAKQIQEAILVENALAGNYNPQFSVFVAKNAFGWKDKTEVEQKTEHTFSDKKPIDALNDILTGK